MSYAPIWMLLWSHQNIPDQPKFAWELLKTSCLMSFPMFLASSQTGNAMETTFVAVLLPAPSVWKARKNSKVIENKLFKAQQRFKYCFKSILAALHLVRPDLPMSFLFRKWCPHGAILKIQIWSRNVQCWLKSVFFKVVGKVWISVGTEYLENCAPSIFLIKGTST